MKFRQSSRQKGRDRMSRTGDNLYKRKDGRWEGRYIKDRKPNGQICYGYVYHRKYQEAKQLLFERKVLYQEFQGTFKTTRQTQQQFNDWLIHWLHQKKGQVRPATYQSYESKIIQHISPFFQGKQFVDLTGELLQEWVHSLQNTLSINSIHAVYRVFKQVIKSAIEEKLLYRDPTISVILPKQTKSLVRSFSKSEQEALERNCQSTKELPILVALDTGMRIGEILGLQWQDINWQNQTIFVNKTVQRVKQNGHTELTAGATKTENSTRVIPLTQRLIFLLQEHRKDAEDTFIFVGKNHTPIDPRTLRYRFDRIKKQSQVADLPFHALRHTFATRCLERGVSVTTVSSLLGHSSIKLTLDIYTNSFLSEKQEAIRQLEKDHSFTFELEPIPSKSRQGVV